MYVIKPPSPLIPRLPPDNIMTEAVRRKIIEAVKYTEVRLYMR